MAQPDLAGLRVLLAGQAEPSLMDATAEAFKAAGGDVVAAAEQTETGEPGRLDVCVCFARVASSVRFIEADDEAWEGELERHLLDPRRIAMAAVRSMASNAGGSIVLVGSADLSHAYPGRSVASVAMGGLLGLTRSMAIELASKRIRSNLVVAGPLGDADGGPPAGADPGLVERTLLRSPVHRFASPQEVAAAIRFVAGPDAGFMTGQTLRVDGGWSSLNQAPEGMRFP